MNVFLYELKQYKKSAISWSVTFAVTAFVLLSATPLFINDSSGMRDVLQSFPDAFKNAMGIDLDTFFSAVGFYSYIFVYISLMASIQAMSLGLGVISKENQMKTADFLMSKPASRSKIFLQKLLSAICSLVITQACFLLSATLSINYVSEGDYAATPFFLISLSFVLIQMVYLGLGLFIAAVITRIKSTISVTMGVCFGTFMLGMVSAITGSETLRYLSPIKYFDTGYIMGNNAYDTKYLSISVVLFLVLIVASFILYVKKDIKSVT